MFALWLRAEVVEQCWKLVASDFLPTCVLATIVEWRLHDEWLPAQSWDVLFPSIATRVCQHTTFLWRFMNKSRSGPVKNKVLSHDFGLLHVWIDLGFSSTRHYLLGFCKDVRLKPLWVATEDVIGIQHVGGHLPWAYFDWPWLRLSARFKIIQKVIKILFRQILINCWLELFQDLRWVYLTIVHEIRTISILSARTFLGNCWCVHACSARWIQTTRRLPSQTWFVLDAQCSIVNNTTLVLVAGVRGHKIGRVSRFIH